MRFVRQSVPAPVCCSKSVRGLDEGYAMEKLKGMSKYELANFATENSLLNMRTILMLENGSSDEDLKASALEEVSKDELMKAFYATETETLENVKDKMLAHYSTDVISLMDSPTSHI